MVNTMVTKKLSADDEGLAFHLSEMKVAFLFNGFLKIPL